MTHLRIVRDNERPPLDPAVSMLLVAAQEIKAALGSGRFVLSAIEKQRLLQIADCAQRMFGKEQRHVSEQN